MTISLYAATVPSKLQILRSAKGWIDKAEVQALDESEVLKSTLIAGMLPFSYQVKSMAVHSQGAFEAVKAGVFSPDMAEPPTSYAGLRARLDEAIAFLEALTPEAVDSYRGEPMRFQFGERQVPFTVDDFLLSFSQPNFYFHAVTAYDILRAKGVEVGKRDFLGALRMLA